MADSHSARPLSVFLCHASGDKPAVRELYQRLRADSIDAWLDEENLLPGQDWQREIPKAVRASDIVIVCLSRGSINKAGYVQKEIKFALDAADEQLEDTIFLIPLKLEECDVPERLSRWQWVNLFNPNGYERLMHALQIRASGLGASAASIPPSAAPWPQSKTDQVSTPSISNVSGGVNVEAEHVSVGKDVVGRDKIIQANTYIEHATIVQPVPSIAASSIGESIFVPPSGKASIEGTLTAVHIRRFGGVEFVRIPAGKFLMGSEDDNQLAVDDEKPQHTVEIPYDYWVTRYPVTNERFAAFVEAAPYEFDLKKNWKKKANHPVVLVSWHDAMAYCKWLNDSLRSELGDLVLHLPTEAEWEKAARGEYGNEWPWGDEFDKNKCNSIEYGKGGTTPVGAYSPQGDSPYGVADMAGNVWEWCHSLKDSGTQVLRGGSFDDLLRLARCAFRFNSNPDYRLPDLGFRVVVSPGF